MTFTHYSNKFITEVRDVEQEIEPSWKPEGLWLSVDGEDDWAAWCRSNNFNVHKLGCATRVNLKPDANVLTLADEEAVFAFTHNWSTPRFKGVPGVQGIRWYDLAQHFDGIVIAPYAYGCRLHMDITWYYSWDCASGCVWRARAVASVEPLS